MQNILASSVLTTSSKYAGEMRKGKADQIPFLQDPWRRWEPDLSPLFPVRPIRTRATGMWRTALYRDAGKLRESVLVDVCYPPATRKQRSSRSIRRSRLWAAWRMPHSTPLRPFVTPNCEDYESPDVSPFLVDPGGHAE